MTFRKLVTLACLALFLYGALACLPATSSSAEAKRAGKKVVRKLKKRAPRRAAKSKRKIKSKKAPVKKIKAKKIKAKKSAPARAGSDYALPAHGGSVVQNYTLEEGVDDAEAERLTRELKSLGVGEVTVDVANNALKVRFDTSALSSLSIINKLKALGYTVKRID